MEPHAGLLAAAGAALAALPVALLPARLRPWGGLTVVAAVSVVVFADLPYLRYFGHLVPPSAIFEIGQVGRTGESIRALLRTRDLWLLPALLAVDVAAVVWPRKQEQQPGRGRAVAVGALACLLGGAPAAITLGAGLHDPATRLQVFAQSFLIESWGVVNVHIFEVLRSLGDWAASGRLSADDRRRVAELCRQRAARPVPAQGRGCARGANLLLIQVESLQEWVVTARLGDQEVMPFLSSLRSRALFFSDVFDQSGDGRSSDGEFAVLNSQLPLAQGAVAFRRSHNQFLALAELLRRQGYRTLSAHPFDRGFWNRAVLHPRYGFEQSLFRRELGNMANTPLGNYLHAMHYFDASLRELIGGLDSDGLLNNTIVTLYGDHEAGLDLDDNLLNLAGVWNRNASASARLRRVPFFLLLPGSPYRGTLPVVGGQVDIAPTLLHVLGVERPVSFLGLPLTPGRDTVTALQAGSAVSSDKIFVAASLGIPAGGACFTYPAGEPLPVSDCDEIRRRGEAQRAASEAVVWNDLVPELEREAAAARQPGSTDGAPNR